jgi:dCMP deaminase
MTKERPSWDEYFMQITDLVATRSTCLRRKVGAILVRDRQILSTGYNGAPSGLAHCLEVGCLREQENVPSGQRHEMCRAIHAEQNAIIQAARHGVSIVGAILYTTHQPCVICTKMLINVSVEKIYYREGYPDELSKQMLAQAGVELIEVPS